MCRSASMSNLRNGMFIQQTEQACQEKDTSKKMAVADSDALATEWRLARSDLHTQSLLMNSRYRSMSDTPSTSLSGNEDVSQVSTSPDHPVSQVATSQHGDRASPSNSSSSARRFVVQNSLLKLCSSKVLTYNTCDFKGWGVNFSWELKLWKEMWSSYSGHRQVRNLKNQIWAWTMVQACSISAAQEEVLTAILNKLWA